MLNVLLIDDDEKLAPLLTDYCGRYGIEITAAQLPSVGLSRLKETVFDGVILDVMLPEMDGFEVCRAIRRQSDVPIIMLTARGEVTDRIVGLEIGADDYLPKPFEPRELVARINNMTKRKTMASASHILSYDDLQINENLREVKVQNNPITLTTMEYELLLFVAKSPGEKFSRDAILNHLKGTDSELFSRSIDILVSRLRQKLKPLNVIKTIHGAGYAFIGEHNH